MTRMTRELSLVVLGAGVLTAGYFLWPEQDFEKRAEDQARQRAGATARTPHVLFLGHFGGSSAGRSPAMAGVTRGGLGSIGGRVGG